MPDTQNIFSFIIFSILFVSLLSSCQKEDFLNPDFEARIHKDEKSLAISEPTTVGAISLDKEIETFEGSSENKNTRTLIYSNANEVGKGQWIGYWFDKSGLPNPMEYKYEVEVHTINGDPDLYIYGYDSSAGAWRRVRQSINPGGVLDETSFRSSGFVYDEDMSYVGVYGYINSTFEIRIYRTIVDCQEFPPAEQCYEFQVYPLPTYCGCDGITYEGFCGPFMAGITSFSEGPCGGNGGGSSCASFPYSTDFSSLGSEWKTESNSSAGRIQITSNYEPYTGNHLVMDVSTSGYWNRNRADLHIDLSNATNFVDLKFKFKDFSDEYHSQDGIYFSDNGGTSFIKVLAINPHDFTDNIWHDFTIYVEQLAANYGLDLNSNFVIRIQQYDNYSAKTDGFAIENLEVKEAIFSHSNERKIPHLSLSHSSDVELQAQEL